MQVLYCLTRKNRFLIGSLPFYFFIFIYNLCLYVKGWRTQNSCIFNVVFVVCSMPWFLLPLTLHCKQKSLLHKTATLLDILIDDALHHGRRCQAPDPPGIVLSAVSPQPLMFCSESLFWFNNRRILLICALFPEEVNYAMINSLKHL